MLPALYVNFKAFEGPNDDVPSRIVSIDESQFTDTEPTISIEITGGDSIGEIPFHILPLTYDQYEARFPNADLDNVFPSRPPDPAGGGSSNLQLHS